MGAGLSESSKIIFLSDAHLGAFSEAKNRQLEQELIQLIDYAEHNQYQIAVLGDLFDYWIEYPQAIPSLGKKLLDRFQQFHLHSAPSLYITGNHDNWTLGHFADRGFDVEPDYRLFTINNSKVLLIHGDATGDDPKQLSRPLFHRIIRHNAFLKIYRRMLSPKIGLEVMKKFSSVSRGLSGKSDPAYLTGWTNQLLKNSDIDFIICGHDHQPRILKYDYGTYLNIGTFYQHHSLVAYNNGDFSLVKWSNNQQQIIALQK